MLALDPPGAEELTVGEAFDRALFGPRAHRYGLPRDLVLGIRAAAPGRHRCPRRRQGGEERRRLRPAEAVHGRPWPWASSLELTLRLHPLPARDGTLVDAAATRSCSSRWRPRASSTPGRRSGCWCASRARSPRSSPSRRRQRSAARSWMTTRRCGPSHRERPAGLELSRCPPAEAPERSAACARPGRDVDGRPLGARPAVTPT